MWFSILFSFFCLSNTLPRFHYSDILVFQYKCRYIIMKILVLNRRHYPEVVGGSYRYQYDVEQHLARQGHDVHTIYCTTNPENVGESVQDGVRTHIYYVKPSNPVFENYGFITNTARIAEILHRKAPFDIVNFHCPRVPLRLFASRTFADVPFVFNCQADSAYEYQWDYKKKIRDSGSLPTALKEHIVYPFHFYWLRHCMNKALQRSNGIIVLSDYVKDIISKHYGERHLERIEKIPGGVDIERFRPAKTDDERRSLRERFHLPQERMIFITVRRLALRMGLQNLVEAVKLVVTDQPALKDRVYFVLVGKGPLKSKLEQMIDKYDLNGVVHLAGFVSDDDLPLYYRCADCSIIPTEQLEGFGIVTIEAFASGLPVVGTTRGAVPEVVSVGDPQLVAPGHRPEDIARGIRTAIDKIQSGKSSPHHFRLVAEQQFSWDIVIRRIEKYYEQVVMHNE